MYFTGRRVKPNDYYKPKLLHFRGTTDDKGTVPLNLIRESSFSRHDELAVTDIFMDIREFKNVEEGRHFVAADDGSQGNWDIKILPATRVVTVENLANVIQETLVGLVFSYTNSGNVIVEGIPGSSYKMNDTLARCLGFLTPSGQLSAFVQDLNKDDVLLSFQPNTHGRDDRELHIQFLQNGSGKCRLLTDKTRNIWNYVSEKSIQTLFLYCNLLEPTLVGAGYFKHLLNMNFPESADMISRHYGRNDATWQRIKETVTTLPKLTIADGQGNTIPNIFVSCNLSVRRRSVT